MLTNGRILFILFCLFWAGSVFSQTEVTVVNSDDKKNRALFTLGYTFVPKGLKLESSDAERGFFVPVVGFDYFRKIHQRWEVGLMWDWELDHYIVSGRERERAMIFALVSNYALTEKWSVFGGAGAEFEQHDDLAVFRIGTAYAFEMDNNWQFVPVFSYDLKKGYDTWSLSAGFSKLF